MPLWRQPLDRDRILVTHGIVHIIDDRCKGCGFCIEFCPQGTLEISSRTNAKGKLTIAGPGAQKQVGELDLLLDAAPALKPQVEQAEWVGNRRWNLTFKTGQMLALPEGEDQSASALVSFAKLDGHYRLLGGKVVAVDMRVPEQAYFRCTGGPCSMTGLEQRASAPGADN